MLDIFGQVGSALSEYAEAQWRPRDYQRPAWDYLVGGGKRAYLLRHRRSGKDELCLRWTFVAARRRIGSYWHMMPTQGQARRALWRAVDPHQYRRRIDLAFPPESRASTRDQEMLIEFRNGSTRQLLGSDNYNALVGAPPVGLVFSEWPLSDPQSWGYLSPILAENKGWVIFNGTPRGPNHGQTLFEHARSDPDWFCQKLTAHETGVLTPEELESERRNFIGLYGQDHGESMFQQEYECSFTAAVFGTFYGREMAEAEREGRICGVQLDRSLPIFTSWDLGYTDATAIWFVQKVGREIRLVGYYESSGHGLRHYVELLEHLVAEHDVRFGGHILPHDVRVKELGSGKSRLEMLEAMGMVGGHLGRIEVAPALHDEDEIAAVRSVLPRCWFDEADGDYLHVQSFDDLNLEKSLAPGAPITALIERIRDGEQVRDAAERLANRASRYAIKPRPWLTGKINYPPTGIV
jgi:phage terminase large subunit